MYAFRVARIRIVDEWLRSPVSLPSHQRAIMVVASSWSEQRVLMRAFAESADQTRPTITLHGQELAIGPAGMDPHGHWGIHVQPPVDGRAQELRGQLELAARRLAGSKGNPPRLVDEVSAFDQKNTNLWAPGTPPAIDSGGKTVFGHDGHSYYEPAAVAPAAVAPAVLASAPASHGAPPNAELRRTPPFWSQQQGPAPASAAAPTPARRRTTGRTTVLGFGQPSATSDGEPFAHMVKQTMPPGFSLEPAERTVLDAMGKKDVVTAAEIAALVGVSEPVQWMQRLIDKLGACGVDLVSPGEPRGGEPTYRLRR